MLQRAFAVLAVLFAMACGSSASTNESPTPASRSPDSACDAAKRRTFECKGDAADSNTGELQCRAVRCVWDHFRDAQTISESMSKRDCDDIVDDFIEISIQAHVDESGVRDFIAACQTKAAKSPIDGGCNDPGKNSFSGHCDYFAAMNDPARASFAGCLSKTNCTEFQACYDAIFESCGNWS